MQNKVVKMTEDDVTVIDVSWCTVLWNRKRIVIMENKFPR